jgi:hypothetical protein
MPENTILFFDKSTVVLTAGIYDKKNTLFLKSNKKQLKIPLERRTFSLWYLLYWRINVYTREKLYFLLAKSSAGLTAGIHNEFLTQKFPLNSIKKADLETLIFPPFFVSCPYAHSKPFRFSVSDLLFKFKFIRFNFTFINGRGRYDNDWCADLGLGDGRQRVLLLLLLLFRIGQIHRRHRLSPPIRRRRLRVSDGVSGSSLTLYSLANIGRTPSVLNVQHFN